jgi:uncharacterized protein (UPF0548 family)
VPGNLTYQEVGATRAKTTMPHRYSVLTRRELVGPRGAFGLAAEFVLAFGLQRGAGFDVRPSTPTARAGTEVVMRARFGPVRVVAPARVVYVVEEEHRRGFAYGTLAGHPERGEEMFLVERDDDGTWLEIRAFSRPGRWFTRLAGPVGKLLQRRATDRYFDSVRGAVAAL